MLKLYMTFFLLAFLFSMASAQFPYKQGGYKGLVVDKLRNVPIEGATIKNKTTQEVVLTNENGYFSIKQKLTDEDSLIVSAIGHEQLTVAIKDFVAGNKSLRLNEQ